MSSLVVLVRKILATVEIWRARPLKARARFAERSRIAGYGNLLGVDR
jgi:hypothetical protein